MSRLKKLVSNIQDSVELSLFHVLRRAPLDWAPAVGSVAVRTNVRINLPWIVANARKNLRLLRPDDTEAEIDASVSNFLDNVGRLMAEFATVHRLIPEGRIEIVGDEYFHRPPDSGPLIALCLHTGNWEVLAAALGHHGIKVADFYVPPDRELHQRIADEVRRDFGLTLLTPDSAGVRHAVRFLRAGGIVSIFGDEARAGRTMAPLFGRPPHRDGNLAVAARLTRLANAEVMIVHCERIGRQSRFRLHFSQPFRLPERTEAQGIDEDVLFLNDRVEPIIRAHLDQWYFLDDSFAV